MSAPPRYAIQMVGVAAGPESKLITIVGHGLTLTEAFDLSPDVRITPNVPHLDLDATVKGCATFADYAATLQGDEIATFAIEVFDEEGGKQLTVKAWNALWAFHLLSVACRAPCFSLYAVSDGSAPTFSAASRTPFVRALPTAHVVTTQQLEWAKRYETNFHNLISVSEFGSAMRCYGNAHYLPDHDVRIMLLWAGIEGLLGVDAELSRRLALYAALLFDGTPEEKTAHYEEVKKAYGIRSRAVHGGGAKPEKLKHGYQAAARILIGLLAKCVELGRVVPPNELDKLAVSATVK